jgi:hypothetical protein
MYGTSCSCEEWKPFSSCIPVEKRRRYIYIYLFWMSSQLNIFVIRNGCQSRSPTCPTVYGVMVRDKVGIHCEGLSVGYGEG